MEFFGPGVAQLSIADRATIANMCPEYGATAAYFPVDDISIGYLIQTGECKKRAQVKGMTESKDSWSNGIVGLNQVQLSELESFLYPYLLIQAVSCS